MEAEFDDFFNFKTYDDYDPSKDDTRGGDIKHEVELEFLDAIKGCELEIELNKRVVCHSCKGRKAQMKENQVPRECFECGGRGSVVGNYGVRKKCMKCDGSGCQFKTPCSSCEGLGVQRLNIIEIVTLPSGIHPG
mmetsp:Transcript_4132/g.6993  ORF Transcript_4132/g.6993 Transcript_4132/m.6993 type:complete len:135 (+) Transcript_4132:604-1008(+)